MPYMLQTCTTSVLIGHWGVVHTILEHEQLLCGAAVQERLLPTAVLRMKCPPPALAALLAMMAAE